MASPRVDPGRKGGIWGPLGQESSDARLKRLAHENGWRAEPVSARGFQFVHEDGTTLYVATEDRGFLDYGFVYPPESGGRRVTVSEAFKILQGTRCVCRNFLPWPYEAHLVPEPSCKLDHRSLHVALREVIVRPRRCRPQNRCDGCFHCTIAALLAPYQREAVDG